MTLNEIKAKLKLHLVADLKLDVILKGEELKDDEILFGEDSRFDLDSLDYLTLSTLLAERFGVDLTILAIKIHDPELRVDTINKTISSINSIAEYVHAHQTGS